MRATRARFQNALCFVLVAILVLQMLTVHAADECTVTRCGECTHPKDPFGQRMCKWCRNRTQETNTEDTGMCFDVGDPEADIYCDGDGYSFVLEPHKCSSLTSSQVIWIIAGSCVGGIIILGALFYAYRRMRQREIEEEEGSKKIKPRSNSSDDLNAELAMMNRRGTVNEPPAKRGSEGAVAMNPQQRQQMQQQQQMLPQQRQQPAAQMHPQQRQQQQQRQPHTTAQMHPQQRQQQQQQAGMHPQQQRQQMMGSPRSQDQVVSPDSIAVFVPYDAQNDQEPGAVPVFVPIS